MVVSDGEHVTEHKGVGLVTQGFNEEIIQRFSGHLAVGHNRYSTSRGTGIEHAQPIFLEGDLFTEVGKVVVAHNGNLPSVTALQQFLEGEEVETEKASDSKLMALAIGRFLKKGLTLEEAVRSAFPLFTGSFSLLVMNEKTLIAVRDECGIKPISIARLNGGLVVA